MSLERRLLAGIALTLVAAFAALLWAGSLAIREVTEGYLLTRLDHDREAILGSLSFGDAGLQVPTSSASPIYNQPLSGHYFVVRSADQTLRSRSLWDETLPMPTLAAGDSRVQRLTGPGGQPLLALAGGYRKQGRELTLLVAEDLSALDIRIHRYRLTLAGVFTVLSVLLLALLRWLLRRGFRQLDQVQADMQRVAHGEAHQLDEAVPAEVQPLVHELNRLLALLEQRLTRSRNALGNLAHALKTPLSLLSRELARPALDDAQRQTAFNQAVRISELVDRELRRARIAGAGSPGQRFDARAEIPALLETLHRLHQPRTLHITVGTLPVEPLAVDREDMFELLGNLLDNACKWTTGEVALTLDITPDEIRWVVEDDGQGVSADQLQRLTARGSRMDESREGHGLGLSIARDITALYDGSLRFDRSPRLGGLRVQAIMRPGG